MSEHPAHEARFVLWGFIPTPSLEAMEAMVDGLPWGDGVAVSRFRDRMKTWFAYCDLGDCVEYDNKKTHRWEGEYFRAMMYKNRRGSSGFFLEITIGGKDREKYDSTQRDCRSARSILFKTTPSVSDRLLWFAIQRDPVTDDEIAMRQAELGSRHLMRVRQQTQHPGEKIAEVHRVLSRLGFKDRRDYGLKSRRCTDSGHMEFLLSFKHPIEWQRCQLPTHYQAIESVLSYVEQLEPKMLAWQQDKAHGLRTTARLLQMYAED